MNTTKKQPWPTKDAMGQVYKLKLWGSNSSEFYSGEGSHLPEIVDPYIDKVTLFLKSFETPFIVCDLGCGDFNIGKELVPYTKKYFAIDIVKELIDYNQEKFKSENLEFQCLDIAKDDLPIGDCAIIRQVLQHLSNTEIKTILNKLSDFKYIILTEHLPEGYFEPNKDIISGQGIRLKKQSGVEITSPPFNLKVKEEKEIHSIDLKNGKGKIITKLYVI
jgi:hypothetical protein